MGARNRLVSELADLRIREGDCLFVAGPATVDAGTPALVAATLEVVGRSGTVSAPAFASPETVAAEWRSIPPIRRPISADSGPFAIALASRPGAERSDHPTHSLVAAGENARFLTESAPFHYPFGSAGPLERLYQMDAWILILGAGQEQNLMLHLAEVWAEAPYIRRRETVRLGGERVEIGGLPGCRAGFPRIEPVLRQARILREARVGGAPAQLMRAQAVVSMAREMLQGKPDSLLCGHAACAHCVAALKLCQRPERLPGRRDSLRAIGADEPPGG